MALIAGELRVGGGEPARVEVAQEGRLISECVVAAKASIMLLVNAEIAKAEGGAADPEKGAPCAVHSAPATRRAGGCAHAWAWRAGLTERLRVRVRRCAGRV